MKRTVKILSADYLKRDGRDPVDSIMEEAKELVEEADDNQKAEVNKSGKES